MVIGSDCGCTRQLPSACSCVNVTKGFLKKRWLDSTIYVSSPAPLCHSSVAALLHASQIRQSGPCQGKYPGLLLLTVAGAWHSNTAEISTEQTGSHPMQQQHKSGSFSKLDTQCWNQHTNLKKETNAKTSSNLRSRTLVVVVFITHTYNCGCEWLCKYHSCLAVLQPSQIQKARCNKHASSAFFFGSVYRVLSCWKGVTQAQWCFKINKPLTVFKGENIQNVNFKISSFFSTFPSVSSC